MESALVGAVVVAGVAFGGIWSLVAFVGIGICLLALVFFWLKQIRKPVLLGRLKQNPILRPRPEHWWESEAVFNPAAVVHDGRVHLFYRALGRDGVSRIGHASSADGIHFDERGSEPIFDRGPGFRIGTSEGTHTPRPTRLSYRTLSYNTDTNASGGGWGGCEDPRAVKIDGKIYMTFSIFQSWQSMRLAVTSMLAEHLGLRRWQWAAHTTMSPQGETHKNWVLFPEKIGGRFAVLHALTPKVLIDYVDELQTLEENPIQSNNRRSGREGSWDGFVRGAGAPPVKTPLGWLLFYHGMTPGDSVGYKVGAMLLDLKDPTKILYRSNAPVLEPTEWYENDWKPGVSYVSGAVVVGDELLVYYGGGDKYVAAARANLRDFLRKLTHNEHAVLEPVKM